MNTLEAAHTACLRHIMGVSRVERRTLQHIRTTCGSKSLERMMIQRTFRRLGHVMCVPDNFYTAMAFSCKPVGGVRARGAPKATFTHARAYDGETNEWARLERRRLIPGNNGWGVGCTRAHRTVSAASPGWLSYLSSHLSQTATRCSLHGPTSAEHSRRVAPASLIGGLLASLCRTLHKA